MKKVVWFVLAVVAGLLLTSGVEWSPDAWRFFPSPVGNEKTILAAVALLTTFAFAYSDSLPQPGPRETHLKERRDTAKLLTHGLAINAAGYALILTIQGVL